MPSKDGLTKDQRQELDAHIATDLMFGKFPLQVANYEPLKDAVPIHKGHIDAINALLPEKMKNTVIITEAKNENRLALENKYKPICDITLAFANKTENAGLSAAMKLASTNIHSVADLNFKVTIENINTAITPLIEDVEYVKFGITALMLSSGLTDATAFLASLGSNRQAVESVSVATLAVEKLFIPLRKDKMNIDLMMQYFNPTGGIKPDEKFYTSITSSLLINLLPHSHTILEGHVYEAGSVQKIIKNAHIRNLTSGRLAISDLLGYYNLTKFKGGVFEFEISAPGYKTIIVVITVVMGKHVIRDFTLVVSD